MITLTPLSSSASSSSTSEPVSYYLELDDAKILLDLGQRDYRVSSTQDNWDYEERIKLLAPTLSLVLLSHSSTNYLSLYPYARAHWGLKCPVYATQPTVEMGRISCLTEVESWRADCLVQEPEYDELADSVDDLTTTDRHKRPIRGPFVSTVEEIHEAFDWIKAIRYNQPMHLGGELSHLLLTPFPSGHVLGGTLFKIRSPTSGTVLYAVGMNHTGERHLDGMVTGRGGITGYAEDIRRPDLLIVEGDRSLVLNPKRRDRERAILDIVTSTLESSHSILLPSDPSPRLLELLILLDQHWSFKLNPGGRRQPQSNWSFPLCLVSKTAKDMVSFARSLIEWMGGVVREPDGDDPATNSQSDKKRSKRKAVGVMGSDYGVLDFTHVQFFTSPAELLRVYPLNQPKLVIAIPPTMSHGPSRFLFTIMANTPGNIILLTSRGANGTLARDMYDRWEHDQQEIAKWGHGGIGEARKLSGPMSIEMNSKVPLRGVELEVFEEEERLKKEREAAHRAAIDRSRRMLEADDLESDSDSESEGDAEGDGIGLARAEGANAFAGDGEDVRTMSFDIFVKGQQMRIGRGAVGEMARFRMFPFITKGRKVDAYGEGLDIGQWVRKGREIEEEGETEEVRDAKRKKLEEEEKAQVPLEPPSKFINEEIVLDLQASILFVDMEGMHDGQALRTIIADLQPRKLILIKSTKETTQALLEYFESTPAVTAEVYCPDTNETVRIGEHVQSYSLQLGDSISALVSGKLSKFESYEVAMVDGKLAFASGSTVPILEAPYIDFPPTQPESKPDEEVEEESSIAKIEPEDDKVIAQPTQTPETTIRQHSLPAPSSLPSSLFIGDLRLLTLKMRLATLSIPAVFAGEGVLVCGPGVMAQAEGKTGPGAGDIVAVRKLAEGQVVIEGAVGEIYFAVRKELYGSYAQVTTV